MSKFDYVYRRQVKAIQWTQKNLNEVKELLSDIVEHNEWDGPQVYSERLEEPFFGYDSYHVVKFYAWADDQEVDPGMWIVIYDDGDGEIMSDEDFRLMYEKV